MRVQRLKEFLLDPLYAARRAQYWLYERAHPDEPWLSQEAVAYCDLHLTRRMRGLETGSGRSTSWFAERLEHLISIEHHEGWYHEVKAKLAARGVKNVDYRYVPLDHPLEAPSFPVYDPLPRYVQAIHDEPDASLDLVVVDGHYRQACVRAALPKLRTGGYLLVDNTNRLPDPDWGVPRHWSLAHRSKNVMTETTIWQKP